MIFFVEITDALGRLLGPGPIVNAIRWTYRQKLSQAGEWTLEVPAGEERLKYATLKTRLNCYTWRNGAKVWLGGGPLENTKVSLQGRNAPTLVLSGNDMLRELASEIVSFTVDSTVVNPAATLFQTLFAAVPGWTFVIDTPLPTVIARFANETVLSALISSCSKMDIWFRLDIGTTTTRNVYIGRSPVGGGVRVTNQADPLAIEANDIMYLITDIERQSTAWDIINRVKVYGAGTGEARLTLWAATTWPDGSPIAQNYTTTDLAGHAHTFAFDRATNIITDITSRNAYGAYTQAISFKDITPITDDDADIRAAANMLVLASVSWLLTASVPQEHYSLSVTNVQREIKPGQAIQVYAKKLVDGQEIINVNKVMLVQEVETQIDANGSRITGLTVSTSRQFAITDVEILTQQFLQAFSMEAHPQTTPACDTISYREEIDDSYGATFPFWLSRGVTILQSVVVRFRIDRLRSTVTAIGHGVQGTVIFPAHTHTVTIPGHGHDVPMYADPDPTGAHSLARIIYFNVVDNELYFEGGIGQNSAATTTEGGIAAPTTSDGQWSANWVIDLSEAIGVQYGVYEDPIAPYEVGDLEWKVNELLVADAPLAIVGGWYEMDVTGLLINPNTLRPITNANAVTVAVLAANKAQKRARITVQIEVRTVIQSLAVI